MKHIFLLIVVLALIPVVSAYDIQEYSADYELFGGKALVSISFTLDEDTSKFSWELPSDASQVDATVSYYVEKIGDSKVLFVNESVTKIEISYVTDNLVDVSKDYYFLLDMAGINAKEKSVFLRLPEDAKLKHALTSSRPSIIPSTNYVATDGRRIIIHWGESDFDKSEAILVIYEMPFNYTIAVIFAILAGIIFAGYAGYQFGFKRLKPVERPVEPEKKESQSEVDDNLRKELTRNLFEDEKLIVEKLIDAHNHELWQKQLELRTKIPKVRLSRKLRSLEQKEIIEKIPYGNTNHIRLKKST